MQNRRNYTPEVPEFKEKLVSVNRVAKVVKGGKIFRFSALIVVGDEKGRVGVGMGKAAEIPEAVRKGVEDAKRHLINVPIVGTTIPTLLKASSPRAMFACSPQNPVPALSRAVPFAAFSKWSASKISAPRATVPTTPQTA